MRYFSIITAAATPLTTLPVFDGIKVYHATVISHYMPSCDDCCVLCRNEWCEKSNPQREVKITFSYISVVYRITLVQLVL